MVDGKRLTIEIKTIKNLSIFSIIYHIRNDEKITYSNFEHLFLHHSLDK